MLSIVEGYKSVTLTTFWSVLSNPLSPKLIPSRSRGGEEISLRTFFWQQMFVATLLRLWDAPANSNCVFTSSSVAGHFPELVTVAAENDALFLLLLLFLLSMPVKVFKLLVPPPLALVYTWTVQHTHRMLNETAVCHSLCRTKCTVCTCTYKYCDLIHFLFENMKHLSPLQPTQMAAHTINTICLH